MLLLLTQYSSKDHSWGWVLRVQLVRNWFENQRHIADPNQWPFIGLETFLWRQRCSKLGGGADMYCVSPDNTYNMCWTVHIFNIWILIKTKKKWQNLGQINFLQLQLPMYTFKTLKRLTTFILFFFTLEGDTNSFTQGKKKYTLCYTYCINFLIFIATVFLCSVNKL